MKRGETQGDRVESVEVLFDPLVDGEQEVAEVQREHEEPDLDQDFFTLRDVCQRLGVRVYKGSFDYFIRGHHFSRQDQAKEYVVRHVEDDHHVEEILHCPARHEQLEDVEADAKYP